jgi:hypothetical protein
MEENLPRLEQGAEKPVAGLDGAAAGHRGWNADN